VNNKISDKDKQDWEEFLAKDNRKIMNWVEGQNFEILNFENKN